MSLVDSDKNNSNRNQPILNASDVIPHRMAHETNGITNRAVGSPSLPDLLFKQGVIKSKDTNGLTNVFFGYDPNINTTRPVLRVAKDGYDAQTAPDNQLIFNSEQNVFKIVDSGTLTIPAYSIVISNVAGGYYGQSTLVTVPHGLGYRPAIIAFVESDNYVGSDGLNSFTPISRVGMPFFAGSPGGFGVISNQIWVENDNIIARGSYQVYVGGSGYGGTQTIDAVTVRYYLLQETAN